MKMVSWEVFLAFLAFLLIYYLIFFIISLSRAKVNLTKREKWLKEFENANYQVSDQFKNNLIQANGLSKLDLVFYSFINSWTINKNELEFLVSPMTNGDRPSFQVKFYVPAIISKEFDLTIQKRGFFSKLFGMNKGEYGQMNTDLGIYGSNIMLVKHLLNKMENLFEVKRAVELCGTIDLDKENTFNCSQDATSLIHRCNIILDFVEIFNDYLKEIKGEHRYTLDEILDGLDLNNINFECIICYQAVDLADSLILNCCSTIGHKDHLQQWLDKSNICPYCRESQFTLLTLDLN